MGTQPPSAQRRLSSNSSPIAIALQRYRVRQTLRGKVRGKARPEHPLLSVESGRPDRLPHVTQAFGA